MDKEIEKQWKMLCLTNALTCAIIIKLLHGGDHKAKRLKKVFQKNLEKHLTNASKCDIINKLSRRRVDREW